MRWLKPHRSALMYLRGEEKRFRDDFIYKAEAPVEAAGAVTVWSIGGTLWLLLEVQKKSI